MNYDQCDCYKARHIEVWEGGAKFVNPLERVQMAAAEKTQQ